MPLNGLTVREAIAIALEGLPGTIDGWVLDDDHNTLRWHVIDFVVKYALKRGVILNIDKDIVPEINTVISSLRGIAVARTKTLK